MALIFAHTDSDGDCFQADYYDDAEVNPFIVSVTRKNGDMSVVGLDSTQLRALRDALAKALGERPEPQAVFSGKETSVPDEGLDYITAADVNNRIGVAFSILAGRAHTSVGRGSSDIENGVYALIRDLAEEVTTAMRNLNEEGN